MPAPTKKPFPTNKYTELAPIAPTGEILLSKLFPISKEVEIEIGFGRGFFLLNRSRMRPNSNILGIEINRKWATKVSQRCKNEQLFHTYVLAGDAREVLPRLKPNGSISRFFIHFPDPWWKKRHRKRCIVNDVVLQQVTRLLRPQGEFFVQTDVEERVAEYIEKIRSYPELRLQTDSGLIGDNPYGIPSNRERHAVEDGIPVYRVLAIRL